MMSDDVLKLHLVFLEKYFRSYVASLADLTSRTLTLKSIVHCFLQKVSPLVKK